MEKIIGSNFYNFNAHCSILVLWLIRFELQSIYILSFIYFQNSYHVFSVIQIQKLLKNSLIFFKNNVSFKFVFKFLSSIEDLFYDVWLLHFQLFLTCNFNKDLTKKLWKHYHVLKITPKLIVIPNQIGPHRRFILLKNQTATLNFQRRPPQIIRSPKQTTHSFFTSKYHYLNQDPLILLNAFRSTTR